jgi:hypothetical protein
MVATVKPPITLSLICLFLDLFCQTTNKCNFDCDIVFIGVNINIRVNRRVRYSSRYKPDRHSILLFSTNNTDMDFICDSLSITWN